ncbi:MAG: 4-(cytidine 5'-diphospho)-2-C-methyl-D-erythritol kinase [Thermoanaerobaculia bacterium]|nr:4-(cytidine 5'-diphospho)-2-C-methyl-D-erythritol kinase [Thermoanaerobaculia bacterium]
MSQPQPVSAFAKVNLHLQLVGRRPDGYHELRTLFQTIELADTLEIEVRDGRGVELEVEGSEIPSGPENLAARAATGYLERWGRGRGARIRLRKRIPVGAGLGGGSSDAAAVLRELDDRIGPAPPGELWGLARDLGADVPYFLLGGTAMGVGRGDELIPVPDLEPRTLWIVVPPWKSPTEEVYGALTERGGRLTGDPLDPRIAVPLGRGELDWETVARGRNDLESVVFSRRPELRATRDALAKRARFVRLSGSGSALFALPDEGSDGGVPALPPGWELHRAETLTRAGLEGRRARREEPG